MRTKTFLRGIAATLVVLAPLAVQAIDAGDPLLSLPGDTTWRMELIYDQFDRDVTYDFGTISFSLPGGGIGTDTAPDISRGMDEKLYLARATWFMKEDIAAYAEVGWVDEKDADSTPIALGLGGRVDLGAFDPVQLQGYAAGRYVPSFDVSTRDMDPDVGPIKTSGDAEYYELGAGVVASLETAVSEVTVVPYFAVGVSILRGSTEIRTVSVNIPEAWIKTEADLEEEGIVNLAAGVCARFCERWSVRVEGRFLDDSSYTVGVGLSL